MTLFQRIEAIEPAVAQLQTDVSALKAAPAGSVTPDQLAAVEAQVTALAALVGTPATPPSA